MVLMHNEFPSQIPLGYKQGENEVKAKIGCLLCLGGFNLINQSHKKYIIQ